MSTFFQTTTKYLFYFLFFTVPFLITPVNYELFEFNKMVFIYAMTTLIGGSWLLRAISEKKVVIYPTPLDIPIALFLLSQLISTIVSIDPHISIWGYYGRFNGGLISIICYIILYYIFINTFSSSNKLSAEQTNLPSLFFIIICSAIVVSLYAVGQRLGIDASLWVQDVQNRVFSTLGQPNWLAAYIVGLLPLVMSLYLVERKTLRLFFYLITAALLYTVLLFTKSRSGFLAFWAINTLMWIGIIVSYKLSGYAPFLQNFQEHFQRWFRRSETASLKWSILLESLLVLNSIFVIVTFIIQPPTPLPFSTKTPPVEETIQIVDGITDSGDIRKIVWTGAWNAALSRPYFGYGTETFAWAYYQFRPLAHNVTSEWDFLYNKAHNEYLNYATTTGFFGLGSYLVLIFVFCFWTVRYFFSHPLSKKTILIWGIFCGWCTVLITNFFGFSVVVTSVLFWILSAMVLSMSNTLSPDAISFLWPRFVRVAATTIVAILVLVLLGEIINIWWADFYFASGISSAKQNKYQTAYQELTLATTLRPGEPMYQNELSETQATLALAAFESDEATASKELTEQAIIASNNALHTSPANLSFWKTRTRLFYTLSQIDPSFLEDALESISVAVTLAPTDPKIHYNRAILENAVGKNKEAISTLKKTMLLKPNYRDAAWALVLFYEEEKDTQNRDKWLYYILEKINPDDQEVKEKLAGK